MKYEFHFGIPYGVRGLCHAWQTENDHGSRPRPKPTYRSTMVIWTKFGEYRV